MKSVFTNIKTLAVVSCLVVAGALGACSQVEDTTETLQDGADAAGEVVEGAAEATGDAVEGAVDATADAVDNTVDAVTGEGTDESAE